MRPYLAKGSFTDLCISFHNGLLTKYADKKLFELIECGLKQYGLGKDEKGEQRACNGSQDGKCADSWELG